jgi:putative tRNA adenosine deaminase-associated protein
VRVASRPEEGLEGQVSYFAAAFARSSGAGWDGLDIDLDEVETLDELADVVREAALDAGADDEVLVVLLEQPDEWFGVVRLDADEDPRVFVSDAQAALRHALGEILLPDLVPPVDEEETLNVLDGHALLNEDAPDAGEDVDALTAREIPDAPLAPPGPTGDQDLLTDLGVGAAELTAVSHPGDITPSEALTVVAERIGCIEALEAVR